MIKSRLALWLIKSKGDYIIISIRRPQCGDYMEVKKMIQSLHNLHQTYRPDIYADKEIPFSIDDFTQMISKDSSIVLLAELDNKVVGICTATIKEPPTNPILIPHNTAYIEDIYVEPKHSGMGIGKMLFKSVEDIVTSKNIDRIDLMVWSFNEEAIAFYESIGMSSQRIIMEKKINK